MSTTSITVPALRPEQIEAAMSPIYQRGDRFIGRFLLAHMAVALALAPFYGTWLITLSVGPAAVLMFHVSRVLLPRSFFTRCVAGTALQTFVALHIYQFHGQAEQHFWFFTAWTIVIVYQDWVCMWPGALLIIGQHILFALLHNAGMNLYFFDVPFVTVTKLFFHFGIALVQVGICGYWAHLLREKTLADEAVRLVLAAQGEQLARQSEALREAHDTALDATRLKSEFLANMSHEVRTPMNAIMGTQDLLLDTELTTEQREFVQMGRTAAGALLGIVNDILDFSKIEAGKLDFESIPFELHTLVEDTVDLLAQAACQRRLDLACLIAPEVPHGVTGDPGRVRQVLVNLLSNAIKYTEHGAVAVTVTTAPGPRGVTLVRFAVKDTGIGITPEQRRRLFQPFSQGDGSMTRRFGGTGLGLAICKQLVSMMGGEIGLESEPGRGSTFTFIIPFAEAHARALPVLGCTAPAMVVAPSVLAGDVLVRMLGSIGVRADGVETTEQALAGLLAASARGEPYALVLIAGESDGVDALGFAQAVRDDPALAAVPLVRLGQRDLSSPAAAVFASQLRTPVRRSKLLACVQELVASERKTRGDGLAVHQPPRVRGLRVLLADDNAANRIVTLRLLEQLGHTVDVVVSGLGALDAYRHFPAYDVLILDCHLPEMDGFATAAAIRALERGARRMPIIAYTPDVMTGDRDRCVAAGVDDYLPQPVQRDALRAVLERWGYRNATSSPVGSEARADRLARP